MNVEPTSANPAVTGAIRQAARMTGADFQYLLATAQVESSLNPNAQVATSSARGLFQFIDQTWLATLKEQGPALGYAPYANAITRTPAGDYAVADPKMANAVMNLRADPNASALMAGAFTKANAEKLAVRLGRNATEGELYIAHFLGSSGAGRLIALADARPQTPAAAVFPGAARANPTIFYDARGQARSASEVYGALVTRYRNARGTPPTPPVVAADGSAKAPHRTEFLPERTAVTSSYAAASQLSAKAAAAAVADRGPVFHSLFRTGGEPVAPVVSALWTTPPPVASPAAPPRPAVLPENAAPENATAESPPAENEAAENPQGTLDLFQDQLPDARALFRGRV